MTINERFGKIIRILYGGNKRAFATDVDVSPTVIENVVGKRQGKPSFEVLEKICANANVNPEWLITGKGEPFDFNKKGVGEKIPDEEKQEKQVSLHPSIGTPYYDVDFHGGFAEIFNDQTALPTCNVVVPGFEKASVWCNVTGHSMEPRINHGDIIALRECTINDIQFGEIYAVVLDTIRTVKILRKGSTANLLRYIPINTRDFDEQEYPINRIVKIYEVIGSISRFF